MTALNATTAFTHKLDFEKLPEHPNPKLSEAFKKLTGVYELISKPALNFHKYIFEEITKIISDKSNYPDFPEYRDLDKCIEIHLSIINADLHQCYVSKILTAQRLFADWDNGNSVNCLLLSRDLLSMEAQIKIWHLSNLSLRLSELMSQPFENLFYELHKFNLYPRFETRGEI